MRMLKRLLCLVLVLLMISPSTIIQAIATTHQLPQKDTKTVTQTTDPLVDLSDLFVADETVPAPEPATAPTAAPEPSETVPAAPVVVNTEKAALTTAAESENFSYTVLDDASCRIDGYTGEIPANLEIPGTLDGYTVVSIGDYAFEEHTALTSVELPDSMTSIGIGAFWSCSSLEAVTFGSGLTSIDSYAFHYCTSLTSVELPDSVTSIGDGAFMDCIKLSRFTYPINLAEIGVTNSYMHSYGIFTGCTSLESVEVPDGVTILPDHIFYDAPALKTVKLPSTLQEIGSQAFDNSGIVSVDIPDSVTSIGNNAFQSCSDLTSVTFGSGLTSIGSFAFNICTGLTSIMLPDSVTTIGAGAFANCENLSEFTYPASLTEAGASYSYGAFSGCTALESVVIPEGVIVLPDYIFYDAPALKTVRLPSTLQEIGSQTFAHSALVSVAIPDSVTTIGNNAFQSCSDLTSVTFGSGLTSIGSSAFEGCTGLTSVTLPDSVTTIGSGAFKDCENLSAFTYPANLTEAGASYSYGAFSGCTALESVEVPKGVTVLPDCIFRDAPALKSVSFPSTLQEIGNLAFESSAIVSVELPDSVTSIGYSAFQSCSSLESVTFGSCLTSIGSSAFDGCIALSTVLLPNSLTSIDGYAFKGCTALEMVILPDQITELGSSLFSGCTALRSVHLPRNLKQIYSSAFRNCAALTQIYIPNSVTYLSEDAFDGVPGLTFLCDLRSYAAEFALDHQIPIIPTVVDDAAPSSILNTDNSYYIHNYDGLSASGVMSMVIHYELLETAQVSPSAITIHIYDYAALQENMLTLDGKPCTNYEYDQETGRLTVPVETASGTLRFCLKPLRYEALTSYARLLCTDDAGNSSVEVIGAVNSLMPALNISARAETSSSAVLVSGLAIPEADVSLYVDGTFVQTVQANKVGNYSSLVSLGKLVDGKEYLITAKSINRSGSPVEVQTDVIYRTSGVPELLDFAFIYKGNTYSLMETHKVRPYVIFDTHGIYPFRFEMTFPPTDSLETVYVVSTRNDVKKYMEAVWDEELGKYVAEGFFDPEDRSYVPGELSLEYVTKREKVSFNDPVDITSQEAYDALPQIWKDAKVEILKNTENEYSADITLDYEETPVKLRVSTSTETIPSHITEYNAEQYGYTKITDDFGKNLYVQKILNRDQEMADKYSSFRILDFSTGVVQDFSISLLGELVDLGPIGNYKDVMEAIHGGMEAIIDINYLKNVCANNPNLTAEQKRQFNESAVEAMEFALFSTVFKCSLVAMSVVIAPTGFIPILVVTAGTCALSKLCDLILELKMCSLYSKAYGTKFKISWIIDPSGYVYDKVTGKRLQGVTVRAYWVENVNDDPTFWNNPPEEDEYGILWDALDYSQMNPLVTDTEGRYAWDVPEGWWRVSYEKEGYESTWSQWLPVPPPQTEVNIGMQPLQVFAFGDINNDGSVNDEDVILLLWHTLLPDFYPIDTDGDVNRDGSINDEDVILLLWHTLLPDFYPLS